MNIMQLKELKPGDFIRFVEGSKSTYFRVLYSYGDSLIFYKPVQTYVKGLIVNLKRVDENAKDIESGNVQLLVFSDMEFATVGGITHRNHRRIFGWDFITGGK